MNKLPTSKFLKEFPSYTSLVISLKENGKYEKADVLLKHGDVYWTSIYGGKSIKQSDIPKYLKYLIDGVENYTIEVNPNKYSEGEEPIHIFSGEYYYTTNNVGQIRGHSCKAPHKKCKFVCPERMF